MPENVIPGFVPGIVKENVDPDGTGRIKVMIPGLFEPITPFWVMPAGWPGAGGLNQGSQYPAPPVDSHVFVMFEQGRFDDPSEVNAIYLTGYYGLKKTEATISTPASLTSAGPAICTNTDAAENVPKRCAIWENESLHISVIDEPETKKVTIQSKKGGSKIELNTSAGTGGKSELITIEATTAISLYAKGLLDIKGSVVQINGRRVSPFGGEI